MDIHNLEDFLDSLQVPASCQLNKPVYKKMFLDMGALDATDKVCLKDDVSKIRWLYTFKPGTINVPAYRDSEREYEEVAILLVELTSRTRIKRIAGFIQRSIPYPLVLIFSNSFEGQEYISTSVSDKRINLADKEKWVIEDTVYSDWINLREQSDEEAAFLHSLSINNLSFKNFWDFYKSFTKRVIAINCAEHSGLFSLGEAGEPEQGGRLGKLKELERLEVHKTELANRLKKEKQMGRQIDLNTQIKKIKEKMSAIKGSL
ncbi:DUF4391 domain-containing protein [Cobetia sp. QF-1]|uniref:DUF4391 domain-containing protein n=1 Tax=Cobetia sp. QF-1 TaxID=1969833 RepID=UPI000B54292E|nr:DUF4391 domain-containing protein [Cobetia sp. QF-1]